MAGSGGFQELMDEFFLKRQQAEEAVNVEPPKPERTPVDLSQNEALRMRCLELVLEQSDMSGGNVTWYDLLRQARKLENFVKHGY